MNGTIFNIQKFSLHDGPGIRTTVFLKGCPLKCQWCANPESQLSHIQILHDQDKCILCQQCIHTCPHQAIDIKDNHIQIDHQKCVGCLACVDSCPTHALSDEGEMKDIDEIVDICLQDIDFYEESQGGVTISGGEGMSQPQFVKALVSQLKQHHIHTAIETTGYVKDETFYELASLFDYILYDFKHYDPIKHEAQTQVNNKLIIEHLKWLVDNHKDFLVRIPVIPGFNDSLEDAYGFTQIFNQLGVKQVQLLPFHQFGERKYELLHLTYQYKNKKALHKEDLIDYQNIFINQGIDCFF